MEKEGIQGWSEVDVLRQRRVRRIRLVETKHCLFGHDAA